MLKADPQERTSAQSLFDTIRNATIEQTDMLHFIGPCCIK
jgi:hypothetical protein